MKMNMKIRSHRYDINWLRFRHGGKYSKYKTCLSMIILIGIKQYLSNIWCSFYEKVKQLRLNWKKALFFFKKACILLVLNFLAVNFFRKQAFTGQCFLPIISAADQYLWPDFIYRQNLHFFFPPLIFFQFIFVCLKKLKIRLLT